MQKVCLIFIAVFITNTSLFAQGGNLFNDNILHEIYFENADTSLIGSGNYQMVKIIFDGTVVDSVGIKDKGNISAGVPNLKLPLKIKTNQYVQGKKLDGIKEFNLHNNYDDPTMMREKLSYEICAQLGLHTLRTAYAKVFINGKYWGLYTIVESKDELYKRDFDNRDADVVESLDFGNMCFIGTNPDDYNYEIHQFMPNYIADNGNPVTAFERFAKMIDKANNTASNIYMDTVSKYLNLNDWFYYQAANVYMMNFDSYIGFLGNQVYMFDTIGKRFEVIPWDFNASLNLWNDGIPQQTASAFSIFPNEITGGCIASEMNTVPQLKTIYLDALCRISGDICYEPEILQRIDFLKNQIQQAVYSDWRKTFTNNQFDLATGYGTITANGHTYECLKTFFVNRNNFVLQSLSDEGFYCMESTDDRITSNQINLYPNPAQQYFTIETELPDFNEILITEITGKIILSEEWKEGNQKTIQISDWSNGTYFVRLSNSEQSITKILIKD